MGGFLGAVSLLTRVPTRAGEDTARATVWIPVVGALVGLAVAGVFVALDLLLSSLVAALLAIAAGVLLTGALHEDGLADVADAFGAGADRGRTLEIMKDPRHGTYGVLALVLSIGVRAAALAALSPRNAMVALPVAHALARAGSVALMWALPPAGAGGIGSAYALAATRSRAAVAGGIGVAVACAAGLRWAAVAAAVTVLAAAVVARLARKKIGGQTGDVLGAAEQLAEVGILLAAASLEPVWAWS
ncbi:MAG TPA: adenosylcobinamide-GDP ribazoletransferase [Actinomycetota bacterium]